MGLGPAVTTHKTDSENYFQLIYLFPLGGEGDADDVCNAHEGWGFRCHVYIEQRIYLTHGECTGIRWSCLCGVGNLVELFVLNGESGGVVRLERKDWFMQSWESVGDITVQCILYNYLDCYEKKSPELGLRRITYVKDTVTS